MQESFTAVMLFWSAFVISAGPFWTATMAAATTTSFTQLYKDYLLYLIFGWTPLVTLICLIMIQIGGMSVLITNALYFLGSAIIFYMAWKILRSRPGMTGSFNFNWKNMSILTWSNPKVWLLVPAGFLGAKFSQSEWINIALFIVIGFPFFLAGIYGWGMVGRMGAKISLAHVSKFNAALMALFGCYLLYSGFDSL